MSQIRAQLRNEQGFTLVEIAIIAPIVILVLGGILALLIGLMSDNLSSRGELETIQDINRSLGVMEDDVKLTSHFLAKIDSGFTDPYGKGVGNAWSYNGTGPNDRVLVLRAYATTRSPRDSQKRPVYINENGCSTDAILSNPPLTTNIVYFVENRNLYRRTLTDTNKVTCDQQFQRQSCPADLATPNSLCQTEDVILLSDVTKFSIDYYGDPNSVTPLDPYPANNQAALDPATAVNITIGVTRQLGSRNFTIERNLLVSKLNTAN